MRAWIGRGARLLPALAALALLAGCGTDDRWERWQAERAAWSAARRVERIRLEPSLASAGQWRGAERAYRGLAARWPAAVWTARAERSTAAREVALTVGRAAVAAGAIAELRGRPEDALAVYDEAARAWSGFDPVAFEACVARAHVLAGLGRERAAAGAWARVAEFDPFLSGDAVRAEALDAPLLAARAYADLGEERAADSILAFASRRYARALSRSRDPRTAAELWTRLGEIRASLGDAPGALAALRRVLSLPGSADRAPRTVLLLAQRALDLGLPDSARAYATWARDGFGGAVRADGLRLRALAWEAHPDADSALAAWGVVLDDYRGDPELAAQARSRRAGMLERLGRWEQARSEYRALAASDPTHPLALAALVRIVEHHVGRGETALASLEGARALETLDRLIATQHDADVSFAARLTRSAILERLGDAGAERALTEVWRADPGRPEAADAGLAAARRALARAGGRAAAESLYRDIAARGGSAAARRAAMAEWERLRSRAGDGRP